jgi:ACS family sodium-dependent inorganic phosphate cotransporter-like MFS transporter 5
LWDEQTQGIVLGSFFYGYVLSQMPGGRMAELIGGKYVYGLGILLTSIFCIATPIAAYSSLPSLILVRVLTGLSEGVTFPSMMASKFY